MNILLISLLLSLINNVCANEDRVIFDTHLNLDLISIILVFIISIITTIGGVGGGGLLIPTYMLVSGFTLEEAIPLSVATILGDTIVRICNLYNKRHPLNNKRYLIDMIPILLIVPFDGNLSFIGVILSEWTPNIITLLSILVILGFTFYKSIKKAIKSFINENIYFLDDNNLEMIIIDGIAENFDVNILEENRNNNLGEGDTLKDKILKTFIIFISILVISVFSITRSLISKCSLFYWVQIFGQFIIIGIIGYCIIKYIEIDYEKKKQNNYIFLEGDIVWNNKNITQFIVIASLTGILSTYMGIGGGMLITPVMIQAGMIPEVVVATSSITTFFSSTISTINYVIAGKLIIDYAITFSIASALGSFIGLYLSKIILDRFKRQSIIIFVVSLILFTSIILLTVNSVNNDNITKFNFNNVCKS